MKWKCALGATAGTVAALAGIGGAGFVVAWVARNFKTVYVCSSVGFLIVGAACLWIGLYANCVDHHAGKEKE